MSQFAEDTAVERVGENLWRGHVRAGWRIGAVPNGGYVLALAGQALRQALDHPDPLSVNAFYLAPAVLGPIDCRVDVLRRGRNTTHASVQMVHETEGRARGQAYSLVFLVEGIGIVAIGILVALLP